MAHSYFATLPPDLPVAEITARRRRQRHAEWGVAVARMGGAPLDENIIAGLQAYINGALSIEELARIESEQQPSPAYLATLTRHRLSGS